MACALAILALGLVLAPAGRAGAGLQEPLLAVDPDGQIITGRMDWADNVLLAYGEAVAPDHVTNAVQRRLLGFRAAKVVAYRNLLELVGRVHVDSQTLVGDAMAHSDTVRVRVRGVLQGARVVPGSQEVDAGVYRLALQVDLRDSFADAVLPEFPAGRPEPWPAPPPPRLPENDAETAPADSAAAPPAAAEEAAVAPEDTPDSAGAFVPSLPYTGLLVDVRGLDLQPSLAPRVLTADGHEVYSPAFVERTYAAFVGVVGFYGELEAALHADRLGGADANPLVVEAIAVTGLYRGDPVVTGEDAARIARADAEAGFLGQCRVAFLLGPRPAAPAPTVTDSLSMGAGAWEPLPLETARPHPNQSEDELDDVPGAAEPVD